MTWYSQLESERGIIQYLYSEIDNNYDVNGYDYYGKKKKPKVPIDIVQEEMQTRIAEWETNLAQSGGLNE